jgi:type II secretory pathway pseudopilin PulG
MYCAWCGNQVPQVSYAACPRCGNPTNGAQRVAPPSGAGSNPALIIIGVAVGGLVVVAIVGILAAIAIPNLLTALQRSRQKRAMADMRTIGAAVEAYATDKNEYPRATSIPELSAVLSPTYARTLPLLDGWETAMKYECWPADAPCRGYAVGSAGADKAWEHDSLQEYETGSVTTDFDADIIFANGSFAQYPDGASAK